MNYALQLEQTLIKLSIPFYAILILTEIIVSNYQHKKYYSIKETLMNAVLTVFNGGIDLLFRGVYVLILLWFYEHKLVSIENPYWYWFALFFFQELAFYTLHYVDHYCRFFWAAHVTHHSSEYFNITAGFRSSVFQPLYRFIYFIPLAAAGFEPADIILMYAMTQLYGVCVHTKYKISYGWLSYIFVDPSHHRVHHGSNVEYLDKNMGMCLIIFDRLFGTYQDELEEVPVTYGTTQIIEDKSILNTIFHEYKAIVRDFRAAPDLLTGLKYVFFPPGWSHDGHTLTSNQLRKQKESGKA